MIDVGLAWTLTLVSAYMMGGDKPPLPPECGTQGVTDAVLYDQICSGDPLGQMSFEEAVANDPRRIEGLVLQRVLQPFVLAMAKLEHPDIPIQTIRDAMRHSYLDRNHRMRSDGLITAAEILEANRRAWKMNADILKVAFELTYPEAEVVKQLVSSNINDIRRAFDESAQICRRAATVGTNESSLAWSSFGDMLGNMSDVIWKYVVAARPPEQIDDQIQWFQPVEKTGAIEREDLFGATSFDDARENFLSFGSEYEEYIVSGHRAPVIALSQYRRMGGRVF